MRTSRSIRSLAALGAVLALFSPVSSDAATPGYLAMAGDGRGGDGPVIEGFRARDVMFSPAGFPISGVSRLDTRYLAYGTNDAGAVFYTTSPDGIVWSAPSQVRIQVEGGPTTPLTVGQAGRLAATYVPDAVLPHGYNFLLVYAPAQLSSTQTTADPLGLQINNIRYAMSVDGGLFRQDSRVVDDEPTIGQSTMVGAPGSFNEQILGPTDLIYLGRRAGATHCLSTSATTVVPKTPWGCDFVMLYETRTGQTTSVAIAGGVYFVDIGLTMQGHTAPLITEGTGWLGGAVDRAHATILNPAGCVNSASNAAQANGACQVELGLSGAPSNPASECVTTADRCRVGTARSAGNALTYQLDRSAPSVSVQMGRVLSGGVDVNITDLQRVSLDPARYYFAAGSSNGNDTHMAIGADPPLPGPRITFVKPSDTYRIANVGGIEFVLNDDIGSQIGIDVPTLSVSIDGAEVSDGFITITDTIFGAINAPGLRVAVDTDDLGLVDGSHLMQVEVADLDGLTADDTFDFVIDRTAPISSIATASAGSLGWPYTAVELEGTSNEVLPGTALRGMRGVVTNPLGQQRAYERGPSAGNMYSGFSFSNRAADGSSWGWRWSVPAEDPLFYSIPGRYVFEVLAVDQAGNLERQTGQNSRSFIIL